MYALINGIIFDSSRFLYNHSLVIAGDIIADILPNEEFAIKYKDIKTIDIKGLTLSAGFIDLQLNGCGGVLLNDNIEANTLKVMHETNIRFGCTSFLPTLITTTETEMKKAVVVVRDYHIKNPSTVIGIHLEGPYISKVKTGIHNPDLMSAMPTSMREFLCEAVKEVPIKITMAPEVNRVEDIKILTDAGVKVSIGHSAGSYEQVKDFINNGATLATHLFNVMSPLGGRNPGVVGAILDSKEVYAGIIVDGHHVDYVCVTIAKSLKKEKLMIVTDAVTPAGTNIKEFTLAGQKIYVKNGKCVNKDGILAGACIDMMASVKNTTEHANITLAEALNMASLYPAEAMGISRRLGRVRNGYVANLVAFDKKLEACYTITLGTIHKVK